MRAKVRDKEHAAAIQRKIMVGDLDFLHQLGVRMRRRNGVRKQAAGG